MQQKITRIGGYERSQRSVFLFLLCTFCFAAPVKGYSLKNCCHITHLTKVVCTKQKLNAIPHDLPSTVVNLDMSENNISKIGVSDLKGLNDLTYLQLELNKISCIDIGAFADLNSLRVLNLDGNRLSQLQDHQFRGLSNLKELRLRSNGMTAVASSSFQSLTNLKLLDLGINNLQCLTKVQTIVQHLPRLKYLLLQRNSLSTFQSWELLNNSIELTALDLTENPIDVFRVTANVFPNLTRLNLGHCGEKNNMTWDVHNKSFLSSVSRLDISGLHMPLKGMKTLLDTVNSSLTELTINDIGFYHKLKALVNISCKIPSVTTLTLKNGHLKFVPSNMLVLCINVTELNLSENRLKNICKDAFKSLQRLSILNLANNNFTTVPPATRNLHTLKKLDLSHNDISTISCQDFANLTELRVLLLYLNRISTLKDCSFKELRELQHLELQSNHIQNLAGAFKNFLPHLNSLNLNMNLLEVIGKGDFKSLHSLKNLSLHANTINTLEKGAFAGLTNLIHLQLGHNNLQSKQLKVGVFSDLRNLRSLNLMENHFKYETDGEMCHPPFSNLSRLDTLNMNSQHYRLKSHLPRNFLKGLTNLTVFNARNIQLDYLHPHTFDDVPGLKELELSSNYLPDISSDLFSQISQLRQLYLSSTNLGSLDFLLRANLTRLQFLQVRKNAFSVISDVVVQSLPSLDYLDLQGNSFTCDCDNAWFLRWLKSTNQTQVFDAYGFKCNYPSHLKGTNLMDLDVHSCLVDVSFFYWISTTCAVVFVLIGSLTYHLLKWQVVYAYYLLLAFLYDNKRKNRRTLHQYDAFVSYNIHDEPWVTGELLPRLEGEQGWRLCLHHRDFQPGKPIIDNITDAIYGSRKTICVISRHYLESEWCSREIQVASFRLFDERKDVLILVFLEDIPAQLLSPYHHMRRLLKRRTYLSWPRAEQHAGLFWEKLRQALQTREGPAEDTPLLTGIENP